jgi:hypothetical protein
VAAVLAYCNAGGTATAAKQLLNETAQISRNNVLITDIA